jgi:NTE family protein
MSLQVVNLRQRHEPIKVALALQGGGAHTAFGWGVLEGLLQAVEEGAIEITAVSGTSGGALNAAALAAGLSDGPSGARHRLEKLWDGVVAAARFTNPFTALPVGLAMDWNIDATPLALAANLATQFFSPDALGLTTASLANVIDTTLPDLAALAMPGRRPALYVCATDIERTARAIFASPPVPGDARQNAMPPVTREALLASACAPHLFPAIQIADKAGGGQWLWDGGFLGNPALEPLIAHADDLIIVQINPFERPGPPPRNAAAILDRVNELAFNSALLMELRGIEQINALIDEHNIPNRRKLRIHRIADDVEMAKLGHASKLNPNVDFVRKLRLRGRVVANAWRAEATPVLGNAAAGSPMAGMGRKLRAHG